MDEGELRKYIGRKIKEYRNKKKITQKELGDAVGVKDNTVSAYERGIISPDYNILFEIARVVDVMVDDFFPTLQYDQPYLDKLKDVSTENLDAEELHFLQQLIEKTLSLDTEEREKFLNSIKFTVEYYDRNK